MEVLTLNKIIQSHLEIIYHLQFLEKAVLFVDRSSLPIKNVKAVADNLTKRH